jgi:predicted acyltransferase (DUF342 family)
MMKYIVLLIALAIAIFMLQAANDHPISGQMPDTKAIDSTVATETSNITEVEDSAAQEATEKRVGFFKTTRGIVLLIIIFMVLLIIPFLPAIMEMVNPKDNEPLFIDQQYTRDPRHLDKQLMEDLKPFLAATQNGKKDLGKYRNNITVEHKDDYTVPDSFKVDSLVIVDNNVKSGKNVTFNQPLYVRGNAEFSENTTLDIAMVNGDISLGKNSKVHRWISSNANITAGKEVELGKHLACKGILQLDKGCTFTNLYAMPIASQNSDFSKDFTIPPAVEFPKDNKDPMTKVNDMNWYVSNKLVTIPPYSLVNNSMIIKTDIVLRKGSVFNGDLKVYGKVIIEEDVRIYGELLCNGDVVIGEGSFIRENLFTQSTITMKSGVRIGLPGQHKSVIGKKGITIGSNVVIYGNILTAGKGIISA